MARRALAYGIAGAGLLTTLTAMAALHPHQQSYFNALVDAKTPGALVKRYDMGSSGTAQRQSLEYLLARYPDDTLRVWPKRDWFLAILRQEDRDRIITLKNPYAADFYLLNDARWHWQLGQLQAAETGYYLHPRIDILDIQDQPPLHSIRAYGNVIASIVARDVEAYQAAYDDVAANGTPLARAAFDIYAYDDALYYLNANCAPPMSNAADLRIFLHITPADLADLPADSREHGFENRDFWLGRHAAFFDGKCINRQPLPDYPIERVATGVYMKGKAVWRANINLAARAAASAVHDGILAGDYGAPIAESRFDLYLRDNALTYIKAPCAEGDSDARFFLHIFPADPADLPADWREFGFVNLDFQFAHHGAYVDGICVATRELPYPIARVRTGHSATAPGGDGWRADINLAAHATAQATAQTLYDSISAGDYGAPAAQSRFDLYLRDNTLTYLKAPCAEGDIHARFFLHITPANVADLPADARERGFANLDFHFADQGVHAGDICVASLDLPDYPIARIRTGQFVSGEGQLWSAEFPVAR